MSNYTNPDGRTFTIPNYSDFSNGPDNFKAFAATMPSYGSEIMTISAGDAAYEQKHLSRVLWFQSGGEYTLNDSAPVGAQVSVATSNGFVSIMTDGVSAEPAQERLIRPYSMVTCTKIANGMWLVAKGSGASGQYFNEATGGTVTEIANYNGSGELWRVHTFTSSGSLVVSSDADPNGFRVYALGGGGAGGAGGGGGGGVQDGSFTIPSGSHTITIGAGGAGRGGNNNGYDGSASSVGSIVVAGGGQGGRYQSGYTTAVTGGNSGSPQSNSGAKSNGGNQSGGGGTAQTNYTTNTMTGGEGKPTTIRGTSEKWGGGGGGGNIAGSAGAGRDGGGNGANSAASQAGANATGYGAGGGGSQYGGGSGSGGIVIVAYQIG